MMVREILDPNPVTASPAESATVAWERMRRQKVDDIVVLDDDRVVGMLSRHDLSGPTGGTRRRMGRRVGDLMRRELVVARPETTVRRASTLLRRLGIGALPVIARDKLVGIVTVSSLLALLEKELASK
jgi:CBS domain-containing protein